MAEKYGDEEYDENQQHAELVTADVPGYRERQVCHELATVGPDGEDKKCGRLTD